MATKYSFHFRQNAGSWGEVAPAKAVLRPSGVTELYPQAYGGGVGNCGWSAAAASSADWAGATDARISGRQGNTSGTPYYRVDLPQGPGPYRMWLAQGGLTGAALATACEIRDGGTGTVLHAVPIQTPANGFVVDAQSNIITNAAWLAANGGAYVDLTFTSDHLRLYRHSSHTATYINHIAIESLSPTLVDAVLSTEFGTGTHAGTIFAKEPEGKGIGKVSATVGSQAFTLIAGSTYFALETRGSDTWLVTNSTRIPDGWSGTVTVRQTSGPDTRDTGFVLTATAITRPVTGLIGSMTSETFVRRKIVKDVMATRWPGYEGQSFVSDQPVTGGADLFAKIQGITPDGTSWYRLRLQDGTYTGTFSLTGKDFGTGGLLVEPDTGHDPLVEMILNNCAIRRMHWRGLKLMAPLGTPAGTGVLNNGLGTPYAIIKLSGNRMGAFYKPGFAISNNANWPQIVSLFFCEQFICEDNQVNGVTNAFSVSGGRIMCFYRNEFQNVRQDFHALATNYYIATPTGVFADDATYVDIDGCDGWNNPDIYTGLVTANTPHGDYLQVRRGAENAYPTLSAGVNGSPSTPWIVNNQAINPVISKIYIVTAVTGTALIDPLNPPTGTGTGIVSGDVTFDYVADYVPRTFRANMENNCLLACGDSVSNEGNSTPNIQFIINSNSGAGDTNIFSVFNNICASGNIRGVNSGDGDCRVEMNSFVGPATKPIDNDQAIIEGTKIMARKNIVGRATDGTPNVDGSTAELSEGNVIANFKSGAAVGQRPGDVMQGTFTDFGATGWGYSMVDDGTINAATFRSNMSKQMHHITGAAGAKLREEHTVTLTGDNGAQNFALVVAT